MKYKLINSVTKIETICDKVTIDGFEYYVSNEIEDRSGKIAYINNDVYKNQLRIVTTAFGNENLKDCKKVIATTNPNIDIPKVIDEVERLAIENSTNKIPTDIFPDASEQRRWNFEGFVEAYNKSQETHPFSEEDMIEFGEWCKNLQKDNKEIRRSNPSITTKELLQLWKEQKPKIVYYEN